MQNNQLALAEFVKAKTGDYVVPIKDACEHSGQYSEAFPIGYPIFDNALLVGGQKNGGFREGDLVIVTGLSGCGKTTFAQNITLNLDKISIPSLWFSYEVMIDNLYAKFKEMGISDEAVVFTPKRTITGNLAWIKEKIIESQNKYFTKVVFIDHIDFVSPMNINSSDQRRNILRNICQELKDLAIELKIIIVIMAHVKKVQGREVEMQDISESSGIYQLADYVFSVARYFNVETENGHDTKVATNEGIVKILKNRLTGKETFMNFYMQNSKIIQMYDK